MCQGMNKILGTGKIRDKNQFTIPQEVVDLLKLNKGDQISFVYENEHLVLKKAKTRIEVEDFKI